MATSMWRGSGKALDLERGWFLQIQELSAAEAARALGVSPSTISRARRTGKAPRALTDSGKAKELQKAWSAYRHTNKYRKTKKTRDRRVKEIEDARKLVAMGEQGPDLDSSGAIRPNRQVGMKDTVTIPEPTAAKMAQAFSQGGERALAKVVADHILRAYWEQSHGSNWVMHDVDVQLGDFHANLSTE